MSFDRKMSALNSTELHPHNSALKEVLLLTEKVNSIDKLLSDMADELRNHDRRLSRIATMIQVAQHQRVLPPRGNERTRPKLGIPTTGCAVLWDVYIREIEAILEDLYE